MSSQSIPLRHIPIEVVTIAEAIAEQTGLSLTDVYRLALACGVLVEATKITPDRAGTHAGLEGAYLAKALRRHLGSAIDLLIAYGEYPALGAFLPAPPATASGGNADARTLMSIEKPAQMHDEAFLDPSLGDDLESLGLGFGLSQQP